MKQITEASMSIAVCAVNKFMFYVWNGKRVDSGVRTHDEEGNSLAWYVPEFIMQVDWTCNRDHIINKWIGYVKNYSDEKAFMRFYSELGNENACAMLEWIMRHYNGEREVI